MNTPLYIGLNGLAGSGKDTVAKMLKTILNYFDYPLEECMDIYKKYYYHPWISATFTKTEDPKENVFCIAFADQLKTICSTIFGIPVERFYQNKATAWICINQGFQYTEIKPDDSLIITADEYYNNIINYRDSQAKVWMSLREILVYVGTYVLQQDINRRIFVNVVDNLINEKREHNQNLNYIIVTDIRFKHEIDYIRANNGITISIVRDEIKQLDNIAEHTLDYENDWDYIVENNGTYEELFEKLYNLIHSNIQFFNKTIDLETRENIHNYLRLLETTSSYNKYLLCSDYPIQSVAHTDGNISMINPAGGPDIYVGENIKTINGNYQIKVEKILINPSNNKFVIYTA